MIKRYFASSHLQGVIMMKELSFDIGILPGLVLSDYEVCRSNDIEEIRSSGKDIFCENALELGNRSSALDASFYYRKVGKIGVGRLSYGAEVTVSPVVFEDFLLIQIPIRGFEKIMLGNDKILCTPKVVGIINSDIKTVINHQPNTEKLIIRIDKKLIEKNCQQILSRTLHKGVIFDPTMSLDTKVGIQFLHMVRWIYQIVSTETDISPLIVSQFENNIANLLLTYQHNNYSAEIYNDPFSVIPSFIKKVESYIQENAHQPIAINDMAEYAGVSSRSLFIGFRKYRNTTPMRFLKEVRLQYVHEDLLRGHVGVDTVTNIALNWGFSHLGHFSTDYKRRFGNTPYETLLR